MPLGSSGDGSPRSPTSWGRDLRRPQGAGHLGVVLRVSDGGRARLCNWDRDRELSPRCISETFTGNFNEISERWGQEPGFPLLEGEGSKGKTLDFSLEKFTRGMGRNPN